MKNLNISFYVAFILLGINNAQAVSFDCNKASRTSEKAICSNVELSALDDELSMAYKKAVLINPDMKLSQREWIRSVRMCESNEAALNSCIKNAYTSRIVILTNRKMAEEVGRTEPLVNVAQTNGNNLVQVNKVPAKASQQSLVMPSQPKQQPISSEVTSASIAEQEIRKLIIAECKFDKIMSKKTGSVTEANTAMDEFQKVSDEIGNRVQKLSQDQKHEFLIFFKVVRDQPDKCKNPVFDRTNLETAKMYLRNN